MNVFQNPVAMQKCDARFLWLMLIAAVTECTNSERKLPNHEYTLHPISIDSWISPSSKYEHSDHHKKNAEKSNHNEGGNEKEVKEKYDKGVLLKEEKQTIYGENKGKKGSDHGGGEESDYKYTHGKKKKGAKYKKGDEHKKFKIKKGFRNKQHKDEKHKVNQFWDNYETYGTFKKFGKKKIKKLDGDREIKKKKTRKESKSKKENKKKGETKKKSGSKGETGHHKEKKSGSHYNNKSEYHKEKKSKKHKNTKDIIKTR